MTEQHPPVDETEIIKQYNQIMQWAETHPDYRVTVAALLQSLADILIAANEPDLVGYVLQALHATFDHAVMLKHGKLN